MSLFQSGIWYRLFNNARPANITLSSGISQDTNGALAMTPMNGFSSSENWQFFYQDDRYFIRNYDYRNVFQLGLASATSSKPSILDLKSDLLQQWLVEREDDGTYIIRSQRPGNVQALGLAINDNTPQMTSNLDQAKWVIDPNQSAGDVPAEMLLPVKVVEPEPTSTPTPTTNSATATVTDTNTNTSSIPPHDHTETTSTSEPTSTSASNALISSNSQSSPSLSTGAIAGIAIAAVAIIAIIAAIVFFILRRQRSQRQQQSYPQTPKETSPLASTDYKPPMERYQTNQQMGQKPKHVSVQPIYEKSGTGRYANEMPSPDMRGQREGAVELDGGGRF